MNLPTPAELWLYHAPVDLRKSYLGLCKLVEQELGRDAKSGAGYVFTNRSKNLAKILWWDRTGWCLFLKKLSVGRYRVSGQEMIRELKLDSRRYFLGLSGIMCL